jgi:hypothetical protein
VVAKCLEFQPDLFLLLRPPLPAESVAKTADILAAKLKKSCLTFWGDVKSSTKFLSDTGIQQTREWIDLFLKLRVDLCVHIEHLQIVFYSVLCFRRFFATILSLFT